jgi:16S rRNA (uracil1498-N3)-methyltransferase
MSRIRLYVPPQKLSEIIKIYERETIHKLKNVLRLEQGNAIEIFDGEGHEYSYDLIEIKKNVLSLKKNKLKRKQELPKKKITLGFPLVKEEKADFILQKATELGVSTFSPFISERSLGAKPSPSKIERWKRIIIEASRQSQRLWLPALNEISSFNDLCKAPFRFKFVASIKGRSLEDLVSCDISDALIIVGPEGDFSEAEYEYLKKEDFRFTKISENILRTETAAIFSAGLLSYYLNK